MPSFDVVNKVDMQEVSNTVNNASKEIIQRAAFHRRVGMKRKVHELNVDVVSLFELINTHGTEITPRSHVVGKYLKGDGFSHFNPSVEK